MLENATDHKSVRFSVECVELCGYVRLGVNKGRRVRIVVTIGVVVEVVLVVTEWVVVVGGGLTR